MTSHPRKPQPSDKFTQRTLAQSVTITLRQRLYSVIHYHTHEFFRFAMTLQLLDIRPCSERYSPSRAITLGCPKLNNCAIRQQFGVIVQPQRGKDGSHVIIVAEIGI